MLFVDDTIIFCKDSWDEITYWRWTLMWFEVVLGLRVNLEKSLILPMGGGVANVDAFALELGCRVVVLPST